MRLLLLLCFLFSYSVAVADTVNQDNVSGSNSNIESMTSSTTYQSGSSSSNSTTNSSTSNIKSAPMTSFAPSMGSLNNCSLAISGGIQTFGVGLSGGKSFSEKDCQIINLSRMLKQLNMSVAAISLLCNYSEEVWLAMYHAQTYCPTPEGAIGKQAKKLIDEKYSYKMPTYAKYVELELKKKNKITIKKLKTNSFNENMD